MSRTVAVIWHASFSVAAGVLFFFFVLPRWPELMGETSHTLGTVLRIVAGALIGLAALPVVFTLLRTRRPEFRTPQLALSLRTWSIVLHVLAGVLIIGAAVSEIWLSLDDAGRWLFAIYGAAAAIALLGAFCFYLAWVAELPPPPPKPLKVTQPKQRRRGRRRAQDTAEDAEEAAGADEPGDEKPGDEATEDSTRDDVEDETVTVQAAEPATEEPTAEEPARAEASDEPETPGESSDDTGTLRNRRPTGKTDPARRRRRRLRGGVAVED